MYIIVVYDVLVECVNRVKKFFCQYFYWVQNSVFEGEVILVEFECIKVGIGEFIDGDEDLVVIYKFCLMLKREVMGVEKNLIEDIIQIFFMVYLLWCIWV